MKKQATWFIMAMILTSNIQLDYSPSPKLQQNVNWSESVGSSHGSGGHKFDGPIGNIASNIRSFLEKRKLNIRSQNGRFMLFYKVN